MTLWIALGALTGLLGALLYFHRQGKASGRSDALLESSEAKNKAMKEAKQCRRTLCAACLMALFTMSGCAGIAIDECGAFSPIYTSSQDILTSGTERQIVEHNLIGEVLCEWRPYLAT